MTELRESDDEKILQFPTKEGQKPPSPSEDFLHAHAKDQHVLSFFSALDIQASPTLEEQLSKWKEAEIQNLDIRRMAGRDVVGGEDSISGNAIRFHEGIIKNLTTSDLRNYAKEEILRQEELLESAPTEEAKEIARRALEMWRKKLEKVEQEMAENQSSA